MLCVAAAASTLVCVAALEHVNLVPPRATSVRRTSHAFSSSSGGQYVMSATLLFPPVIAW